MTPKVLGRAPGDRSHLERLVRAMSLEQGIAADRMRRWVSTMVLLGALERMGDDEHRFVLKGGVAMELRLQLQARATKDTDIIVITAEGVGIIDALRDALAEPYLDFAFRLANVRGIGDTPAQAMDVKMTYKNKAWATLRLEASPPEAGAAEPEPIGASVSCGLVSTDPSRSSANRCATRWRPSCTRSPSGFPVVRTIASVTSSTCCCSASLNPISVVSPKHAARSSASVRSTPGLRG